MEVEIRHGVLRNISLSRFEVEVAHPPRLHKYRLRLQSVAAMCVNAFPELDSLSDPLLKLGKGGFVVFEIFVLCDSETGG